MCVPLIMAGIMLGGAAMSAQGQAQQGQAAEDAAEYNVAMGEIVARDAYDRAEQDKQLLAHQFLREKAAGQTSFAASGVRISSGSTLDWENDLSEAYISDKAQIDLNASRTAAGIQNQGTLDLMQGKSAKSASKTAATGSLLSGAAGAGSSIYS